MVNLRQFISTLPGGVFAALCRGTHRNYADVYVPVNRCRDCQGQLKGGGVVSQTDDRNARIFVAPGVSHPGKDRIVACGQ
jgi:hypothetical protein